MLQGSLPDYLDLQLPRLWGAYGVLFAVVDKALAPRMTDCSGGCSSPSDPPTGKAEVAVPAMGFVTPIERKRIPLHSKVRPVLRATLLSFTAMLSP